VLACPPNRRAGRVRHIDFGGAAPFTRRSGTRRNRAPGYSWPPLLYQDFFSIARRGLDSLKKVSSWEEFWRLLRSACVGLYEDGCLGIAKGAAYSSLLSFFPVITTLAALLVQAQAEAVSRTIARLLYDVVPPGTEDVVRTLFIVHGERPRGLLIGAAVLAAWAASGAMMSLMEGFRAVYHIPAGRSFVRERAVAMLLVLMSAAPVLGASLLIVFSNRAQRSLIGWLGLTSGGYLRLAGEALSFAVAFGAIVMVTALAYYFGPNRKQAFRNVTPGATLATLLWLAATLVFGWYVRNISSYNVLYGSVGAGLALLVWMYVLAVIVLLGCEFNAAREKHLAPPEKD
jgi:membrane protein